MIDPDPRPDLGDDAAAWAELLEAAAAYRGDGAGVYWALRGARAVGAELVTEPDGRRLRARPGCEADYAEVRLHLQRNAAILNALLRRQRRS